MSVDSIEDKTQEAQRQSEGDGVVIFKNDTIIVFPSSHHMFQFFPNFIPSDQNYRQNMNIISSG